MNSNIDVKALWGKQHTAVPDSREIFKKVAAYKRSHLRKVIATNVMYLLTSAFIICIWYIFQPQMVTTKVGIVLVILAMVVFASAYNEIVPLLLRTARDSSTADYLQQLLLLKRKQKFLHTTMMNIYFIMLTVGIMLYMYEYASRSLHFMIWAYATTLCWIGFNWLFIRPRTIKKQEAKMNEIIDRLETVSKQLSDDQ